jgi:hypothetical protein
MSERTIKIAVVGSRKFYANQASNCQFVFSTLDNIIAQHFPNSKIIIVTGDEPKGVDRIASKYAAARNFPCVAKVADWDQYGLAAGPIRNAEILAESDVMVAFPSKTGTGTQDSISKMKAAGKGVCVISID